MVRIVRVRAHSRMTPSGGVTDVRRHLRRLTSTPIRRVLLIEGAKRVALRAAGEGEVSLRDLSSRAGGNVSYVSSTRFMKGVEPELGKSGEVVGYKVHLPMKHGGAKLKLGMQLSGGEDIKTVRLGRGVTGGPVVVPSVAAARQIGLLPIYRRIYPKGKRGSRIMGAGLTALSHSHYAAGILPVYTKDGRRKKTVFLLGVAPSVAIDAFRSLEGYRVLRGTKGRVTRREAAALALAPAMRVATAYQLWQAGEELKRLKDKKEERSN